MEFARKPSGPEGCVLATGSVVTAGMAVAGRDREGDRVGTLIFQAMVFALAIPVAAARSSRGSGAGSPAS